MKKVIKMQENASVRLVMLRTNDLTSPLGVSPVRPVFSWKTESDLPRYQQSAYRIVVRAGECVAWDSGKVDSGLSVGVVCPVELNPRTAYTWELTAWNSADDPATAVASFETGLPAEAPFGAAKWISTTDERNPDEPHLPVFRKEFGVKPGLKTARLYTSGLGTYESYLNGARVGKTENGATVYDELKPGFTQTEKRKF